MTDPVTERLDRLERTVAALRDQVEIGQLIAGYGPLVDAGDADAIAAMWTVDGGYDVEDWSMGSREEVRDMVASEAQQGLIARGSSHFLGPARIRVDGDTAVAVCESLLVVHRDARFLVARASANRFDLARVDGRWQIAQRTTRTLTGDERARLLLGAAAPEA
ncbi:nuclear transport factor 2 family protein [Gordonia crocea]|uniref:SnoaL-like domain-containing protein n=1 Tax=Gordonia crocea TaxID=589162 RepID=A0A7M4BQ39_9ACTN|nr:nuclear transport factor 2 family protein [Gordonia crocea]GED96000.1 hypothetical protein nbrc107697_00390 [Gordonia crocea]